MSGKPGKQQQQQKRKGEAAPAPAAKKAKENSGAAAPAAAAAAPEKKSNKPQQQQQGGNKQPQAKQGAGEGKKGKKAPEPEPEPEEESEEEGEDDELGMGAPNPEALKAADAVQEDMDKIAAQLDEIDTAQNAEIFAIQKKFLLQKRPVLAKRDALLAKVPGLWRTLFTEHEVFGVQLEEVDVEILDHLTTVEINETYSKPSDPKQQIVAVDISFTFSAGSAHVKAGKFKKTFAFNDEKETLQCVATPAAQLPWVNAAQFTKENGDSFFGAWFASEGDDEGILRAQDALSSELYVDPLQMFRHVAEGGSLADITGGDDDDDDELAMAFGEDGEEDDEDEEAPELADD